MANNYFQFKQFTIYQDQCAMKVCTDSCLFGAWVADILLQEKIIPSSVLDIGSGTGLLSLMLAQKIKAKYEAVETDEACVMQSSENVKTAQFENDISFHHQRIKDFKLGKLYDLIISNPPFYEGDLVSPHEKLNLAKHNTGLTLKDLVFTVHQLLNPEGIAAILLPCHREKEMLQEVKAYGLNLSHRTIVYHKAHKTPFRAMLLFTKTTGEISEQRINIKEENEQYSPEFSRLLKDYYLHL